MSNSFESFKNKDDLLIRLKRLMDLDVIVQNEEIKNSDKKLVSLISGIVYNRLKNLEDPNEINKALSQHSVYLKYLNSYFVKEEEKP